MTESSEYDYSLSWYDYGSIFLTIIIWTVLSFEIINLIFGLILESSTIWFMLSIMLITSYPIPIAVLIWRMKMSVEAMEPIWSLELRYVTFNEFIDMSNEYKKKYILFTSNISYEWILVIPILIILLVSFPVTLNLLNPAALAFLPQVFGAFMILLGIAYTAAIFPVFPSPLEDEFRISSPQRFAKALHMVVDLPALSWIGIRLHIGEWHGYYTLREPVIAAKIENLESAATVIFQVDSKGIIESVEITNDSGRDDFPKDLSKSYPKSSEVIGVLREFMHWYASISADDELLEEPMDELGMDSLK